VLQKEQRFDDITMAFSQKPAKYLQMKSMGLLKYQILSLKPSQLLNNLALKLGSAGQNMEHKLLRFYDQRQNQIQLYNSLLQTLDATNVLKRGFALIKQNGKVVSYKQQMALDQQIEIHLQDGITIAVAK
jgi:exonuclease VII large subunit